MNPDIIKLLVIGTVFFALLLIAAGLMFPETGIIVGAIISQLSGFGGGLLVYLQVRKSSDQDHPNE